MAQNKINISDLQIEIRLSNGNKVDIEYALIHMVVSLSILITVSRYAPELQVH